MLHHHDYINSHSHIKTQLRKNKQSLWTWNSSLLAVSFPGTAWAPSLVKLKCYCLCMLHFQLTEVGQTFDGSKVVLLGCTPRGCSDFVTLKWDPLTQAEQNGIHYLLFIMDGEGVCTTSAMFRWGSKAQQMTYQGSIMLWSPYSLSYFSVWRLDIHSETKEEAVFVFVSLSFWSYASEIQ